MTFISLIMLLGFIGSIALLIMKIGPIYMDHGKVSSALDKLKAMEGIASQSDYQIRDNLRKQFSVNYVSDVKPEDVQITKSGGYLKVTIEYEVVKPIVGNLSVLVEFNDSFEVGG
ncbi:MAG: DUF4845 domain-containing protein [Methylovulum sp.]|nr:DUF4845 domain-containing protein [Methylovulum sp.]